MITMPSYEVRYGEDEEWKDISELELMDGLYKSYQMVAPAIKKIIEGEESLVVETKDISSSGVYCMTQQPVPRS